MTYLSQRYLNEQSDRIERVLRDHRIPARVEGGQVTPRWVRYHIRSAAGAHEPAWQRLSSPLSAALGSARVSLAQEGERLAVNVPRPDAEPVLLLPLLRRLERLPPLTACLGLEESGPELCVRLSSPGAAHMLLLGEAGAGKTELLKTLALSLALTQRQSQLQIAAVDMGERGLAPLEQLPHALCRVAGSLSEAERLLEALGQEMDRRLEAGASEPHILLVVDGLDDLATQAGPAVAALLRQFLRDGCAAGLHLAAAARRPLTAVPPDAFPVIIVGRLRDAATAARLTGLADSSAEQLLGAGDFLAVAAGQAIPFQAAWLPPGDWDMLSQPAQ